MSFLLPQSRLAARTQVFRINQPFKSAHSQLNNALDRTGAELAHGNDDINRVVLGAAILIRALDRLASDGRYCLFRRPTRTELYECSSSGAVDDYDGKGRYYYHFYEVPGFRFIVILSTQHFDGFVVDIERITGQGSPPPIEQLRSLRLR